MRARRRYAKSPSQQIPTYRAHQCAEDYTIVDDIGPDYPRSDGLGDIQAKEQKGDEVEEGGPKHRILRTQDPGRDNRCDGVRRIVQAIEKIERQSDGNQPNEIKKRAVHRNAPKRSRS